MTLATKPEAGFTFTPADLLNAQVSENVKTLMARLDYSQQDMAAALHMGQSTLSRRLSGDSSWFYWEVARVTERFDLSYDEVVGSLPTLSEWRARRPHLPTGMCAASRVRAVRTVNRPVARDWTAGLAVAS